MSSEYVCQLRRSYHGRDQYKHKHSGAGGKGEAHVIHTLSTIMILCKFARFQEMLDINVPKHAAMRQAAFHLNEVYSALSANHPSPAAAMKEHGLKFALQYIALHDHLNAADEHAFRIKPKLHLFIHITSDDSLPRLTWTYRDEDFGGSVARMARRRGGLLRCGTTSMAVLSRFKIEQPCIRIV